MAVPALNYSFLPRVMTMNFDQLHYPVDVTTGPTPPGPTVVTTRPTSGTLWPRLAIYDSVTVVP